MFHRRERSEYTVLQEAFWERVRQSKFREDEEVVQMAQTMAEYVREEARAEGEEQGLKRALIGSLEQRFGALPPRVADVIERADAATVFDWVLKAATVNSLSELGFPGSGFEA
jgi:hypothetical protein